MQIPFDIFLQIFLILLFYRFITVLFIFVLLIISRKMNNYKSEREELVKKIYNKGIRDLDVLKAMNKVERHLFVPGSLALHAYEDSALLIGYGQTISQPYTVAFMTSALQLKRGDSVLEIGTGSGYQAAVLHTMGMRVFSVERNYDLFISAQERLSKMNIHLQLKYGDGTIGWAEHAPFNGIIVTAGAPEIPVSLKKQLKPGGRLVIPVGEKGREEMVCLYRENEDCYSEVRTPNFSFVPLIGKEGWKNV